MKLADTCAPQASSFAKELRRLRLLSGLGQRELARRVNLAGSYVCNIERGRHGAPSRAAALRFAAALLLDAQQAEHFIELAEQSRRSDETTDRRSGPRVHATSADQLKAVLHEAEKLAARGRVAVQITARGIQITFCAAQPPSPAVSARPAEAKEAA